MVADKGSGKAFRHAKAAQNFFPKFGVCSPAHVDWNRIGDSMSTYIETMYVSARLGLKKVRAVHAQCAHSAKFHRRSRDGVG